MRFFYLKIIFLLFSLALLQPVFGQFYYSVSAEREYNTNPFRLKDGEADQTSELGFGVRKDWNNISAQYYGNYLLFNSNAPRNFYWHQFYLNGGDTLNWFLSADNRINRDDYEVYNYFTLKGGLNSLASSGSYLFRYGGSAAYNNYELLPELNNLMFNAFISMNRSFQTRTSIIGAISFNFKNYLNDNPSEEIIAADDNSDISSLLLKDSGNGRGGGNGSGHGDGNPGSGGGPGGGNSGFYYSQESASSTVTQLLLSFRAAQSITSKTGLALQYFNRISLNDKDRGIAGLLEGYDTESQIFDDPMGYEGETIGAVFTWILPWSSMFKASAYYLDKNYISQGIYAGADNYDENILRSDIRKTVYLVLQKKFDINLFESGSITFFVNYRWMENESNSYWYDYNNQSVSAGIDLDF